MKYLLMLLILNYLPQSHLDLRADTQSQLARVKRHLVQFGTMIRHTTNGSPLLFNDYGNHCGWQKGQGPIADDIDGCCFAHDQCYKKANREICTHLPIFASFIEYSWSYDHNEIVCKDSTPCKKFVCQCDKESAECFARYPYNPQLKKPSLVDFLIPKV